MSKLAVSIYEFGPFRLDTAKRLLLRDEQVVPLTPKTFEILAALVENSDRVLEKSELMSTVWPDSFVEESNLTQSVSLLRKALGENPADHRFIVTVPGRGYRFVAGVNHLEDQGTDVVLERRTRSTIIAEREEEADPDNGITAVAANPTSSIAGGLQRTAGRRRRLTLLVSCALLLGVVAAALYLWSSRKTEGPATILDVKSIAVLPFKPISETESDEALEIGMADALITRLSNANIVVRSSGSTIKYHKSDLNVVGMGRELKVDSLLVGSIQKSGERVRVYVQLVEAQEGRTLWSEKFDAQYTDILNLHDSIAEQITQTLEMKLSSHDRQQLAKRSTASVDAFQAYSKGRVCWNRRSRDGFRKAIDYFNEAIKLDPEYALAYTGLADCYTSLSAYTLNPPNESFPRAREAVQKALEIDDKLAEAHASLAHIRFIYDWDWEGAEKHYKYAIDLNPNYASAHQWYSVFLSSIGRNDDAIAQAKLAQELDPASLPIARDATRAFYLARQYDEAIAVSVKAIELDRRTYGLNSWLEMAYEQRGLYDQAIETRLNASTIAGFKPEKVAALRKEYQSFGWKGFWQKELARTEELAQQEYVSPYILVRLYARLGEKEKTLAWLEKAYAEHSDQLVFLKADPIFDGVRSDARFKNLLRLVRLGA